MSRKIKFRVFDKLGKRFTYSDEGYQGHYVLTLDGKFFNLQNGSGGDEYEVHQFVGLKDKNDKDIYEGDIVNFQAKIVNGREFYKNEEVYYSDIDCSFFFSRGTKFAPIEIEDIEVVGNICEGSELLKSGGPENQYLILNKSTIKGGLTHEDDELVPEIIILSNGSYYGDSIISIKFENHHQILIENEKRQEVYGKNIYIEMNKKIIKDLIGKLSYVLKLCKACSMSPKKE